MEDKIRRIMDDSTDYQTGEVDAEIAINKLLVLFNVSDSEQVTIPKKEYDWLKKCEKDLSSISFSL